MFLDAVKCTLGSDILQHTELAYSHPIGPTLDKGVKRISGHSSDVTLPPPGGVENALEERP